MCEQRKGISATSAQWLHVSLLLGLGLHPCSTSWLCRQFLAKHELTPSPEDMTNASDSAPCF